VRLDRESFDFNEIELGQTSLFYARTIHWRKCAGGKTTMLRRGINI